MLGADERKDKNQRQLQRPAPSQPSTAHPPSAPFSCPNSQKGREGMSLQLWELGSGWKPPPDPAQEQVSISKADIHPCT